MNCNKYNICEMIKNISLLALIIIIIALVIFIIISNPADNKSILVSIATSGDNTGEGNIIVNFGTNEITEGNALSHTNGSNEILINENGIYQISYQLTGVNQGNERFNFNSVILVNGIPLNSTLNEGVVLSEDIINNRYTLTSTVILKLNANDILQLGGLSLEDITYPNARIDIEKIL